MESWRTQCKFTSTDSIDQLYSTKAI